MPSVTKKIIGNKKESKESKKLANGVSPERRRSAPPTTELSPPKVEGPGKCPIPHNGREMFNIRLPAPIEQIHKTAFEDLDWFSSFLQSRNCTNIDLQNWTEENGKKTKKSFYTTPLKNPIGAKYSNVRQTMELLDCTREGSLYSFDVEVINGGVPYQDSFYIHVHTCLVKVDANTSHFYADALIKYKKSTWGVVKSLIEKSSYSGLSEFYEDYENAMFDKFSAVTPVATEGGSSIPPPPPRRRVKASKSTASSVSSSSAAERTSVFIWGFLSFLLLFNLLLYWRLSTLENTQSDVADAPLPFSRSYGHSEDWIYEVGKIHHMHKKEVETWKESMKLLMKLVKQVESSIDRLQEQMSVYENQKPDMLQDEIM